MADLKGLLSFIEKASEDKTFFGEILLQFKAGELVLIRKNRTIRPEDLKNMNQAEEPQES